MYMFWTIHSTARSLDGPWPKLSLKFRVNGNEAHLLDEQLRFESADSLTSVSEVMPPANHQMRLFNKWKITTSVLDLPSPTKLGDDNIVPKCSICLKPFTENMAQAPLTKLTNDNGENQPRSAELPAETADSIDIPVRLPCGHVFGRECIYSWITSCRGENPPTCPLCRVVLEYVCNSLTIGGEFYVEVIRVQCPEILNSDRDMNALLDLIMVIHEESVWGMMSKGLDMEWRLIFVCSIGNQAHKSQDIWRHMQNDTS